MPQPAQPSKLPSKRLVQQRLEEMLSLALSFVLLGTKSMIPISYLREFCLLHKWWQCQPQIG